ncbi:hypothetical protein F5Y11DRAFT_345244 [Daldinia sp. FL1419]|nr:hypothetical protein F5Y11DRAFT_345244 [Daldinia sp. FL1419]
MSQPQASAQSAPGVPSPPGGQFGFMSKIGATDEAVRTLNDQPYLFTILVVVLPEQKKKKEPKGGKKAGGKPPAAR